MYINDDGIRLDAELEKPENAPEKMPLVIVMHGFTGHKDEHHIIAAAEAFREAGYATLRVDLYGHGKSDGAFKDHTLYKWMTNAMTVIDYVRGLDFVTDIYLCGHSQGGLLVMLAGGLKHEFIKGIIALSPAAMIPESARRGELLGYNFDPVALPEELDVWDGKTLGSNYIRVAQMVHVEEAIDRYDGPVLIVQGTEDGPSLIQSAKDAAARYANSKYVEIEGAPHCYDDHIPQLKGLIREWIVTIHSSSYDQG